MLIATKANVQVSKVMNVHLIQLHYARNFQYALRVVMAPQYGDTPLLTQVACDGALTALLRRCGAGRGGGTSA
jgi:hypothetical protein